MAPRKLKEELTWVEKVKEFFKKIGGVSMKISEATVGQNYLSKKGREIKLVSKKDNQAVVELVGQGTQAVVPLDYEVTPVTKSTAATKPAAPAVVKPAAPAATKPAAPAAAKPAAPAVAKPAAPAAQKPAVPAAPKVPITGELQVGEKVLALGMKDGKWWPVKLVVLKDAEGMYQVGTSKNPWKTNQVKRA